MGIFTFRPVRFRGILTFKTLLFGWYFSRSSRPHTTRRRRVPRYIIKLLISLARSHTLPLACLAPSTRSTSTPVFQPSFATRSILSSSSQTVNTLGYLIFKAFEVLLKVFWSLNYRTNTSPSVQVSFLRLIKLEQFHILSEIASRRSGVSLLSIVRLNLIYAHYANS